MHRITKFLDDYLTKSGRADIGPVEANALLAKAGILRDSKDRPGKPLRDLLRKGKLPHAYQPDGKGSNWVIPHSNKGQSFFSNYTSVKQQKKSTKKVHKRHADKNSRTDKRHFTIEKTT